MLLDLFYLILYFVTPAVDSVIEKCSKKNIQTTVEPQCNDPWYNDIPGTTMNILCPCKSYSKMCGTEPWYNDLRYNDIPNITMRI